MTSQPDRSEWMTAYRQEMFDTAVKVGAELDGCGIEELRLFVAAYDVVTAVILDPEEPDGFFMHGIKGQGAMHNIIATGEARALTVTALPCQSLEEAEALRLTIGEPDFHH